jgi:hypothetical protein
LAGPLPGSAQQLVAPVFSQTVLQLEQEGGVFFSDMILSNEYNYENRILA